MIWLLLTLIYYSNAAQVCKIFSDVLVWRSHNIGLFLFMVLLYAECLLIQQATWSIVINNNRISEHRYIFNKSYTNLIRICSEYIVRENTADCIQHFCYSSLWLIVVRGSVIFDWCKLMGCQKNKALVPVPKEARDFSL